MCSQGARERARAGDLLAPAVVAIFYDTVIAPVNEPDHVVLAVADVVVIRAVVVHGDHVPVRVVAEQQLVAARYLRDQHRAVIAELRRRAVERLLRPEAVFVVGVGGRGRTVRRARQPTRRSWC